MRRLLAFAAGGCVLLAALAAAGLYALLAIPVLVDPRLRVTIEPGQRPREIAELLEAKGIVRSATVLVALARYEQSDTRIRHGIHEFHGALTPRMVLDELMASPREVSSRVTIPEGLTWRETGQLLQSAGVIQADEYYAAVCSPEIVTLAGASPSANCSEGYLFPDTYEFAPKASGIDIAETQIRRFHAVAGPLLERHAPAEVLPGEEQAVWRNRTLVLASIVEKETGRAEERGLVAGVIRNRLARNMKLQVDPTVIYGITSLAAPWDGNLTRVHLGDSTPYNTYVVTGLPPGPICNPGRASLEAALSPPETDYLYFVARGDGSHEFSSSYADHRKAVRLYQLD